MTAEDFRAIALGMDPLAFRRRNAAVTGSLQTVARQLEKSLRRVLGRRIILAITDNRRTMITARSVGGALEVRVHHMFLDAGPVVVRALAESGVTAHPGPEALVHAQDKVVMREAMTRLGAPQPRAARPLVSARW